MTFWQFLQQNWPELLTLIGQHVKLVFVSIVIAVAIGVPTGILLTRYQRLSGPVLGVANILQTIPSLALFGFLIPLPFIGGIGARTALVALVLYSLLPIIRNTVTGILGVEPSVREAAVAMGMTDGQVLRQVELPLAMGHDLDGHSCRDSDCGWSYNYRCGCRCRRIGCLHFPRTTTVRQQSSFGGRPGSSITRVGRRLSFGNRRTTVQV
jgi:ABC-type spermidine/putrescine transport system permease subunit I